MVTAGLRGGLRAPRERLAVNYPSWVRLEQPGDPGPQAWKVDRDVRL